MKNKKKFPGDFRCPAFMEIPNFDFSQLLERFCNFLSSQTLFFNRLFELKKTTSQFLYALLSKFSNHNLLLNQHEKMIMKTFLGQIIAYI